MPIEIIVGALSCIYSVCFGVRVVEQVLDL